MTRIDEDALALLTIAESRIKELRDINAELRAALKWAGEIIREAQAKEEATK